MATVSAPPNPVVVTFPSVPNAGSRRVSIARVTQSTSTSVMSASAMTPLSLVMVQV
jgi:hypothetical protein